MRRSYHATATCRQGFEIARGLGEFSALSGGAMRRAGSRPQSVDEATAGGVVGPAESSSVEGGSGQGRRHSPPAREVDPGYGPRCKSGKMPSPGRWGWAPPCCLTPAPMSGNRGCPDSRASAAMYGAEQPDVVVASAVDMPPGMRPRVWATGAGVEPVSPRTAGLSPARCASRRFRLVAWSGYGTRLGLSRANHLAEVT